MRLGFLLGSGLSSRVCLSVALLGFCFSFWRFLRTLTKPSARASSVGVKGLAELRILDPLRLPLPRLREKEFSQRVWFVLSLSEELQRLEFLLLGLRQ